MIVREGHHSSAVYFVLHGQLTVSKVLWNHELNSYIDTTLCAIGPGDSFGEVAVMDGTKRRATVITDCKSSTLFLWKIDELSIYEKHKKY